MPLPPPFSQGQLIIAILREPRERMWGRLLGLEPAGLVLRGLELRGWEEAMALAMGGAADQVSIATRFFPMHRVESLYLDEPGGGVPSLAEDFARRTGREALDFLKDLG